MTPDVLRIRLLHEYFGDDPAPLSLHPVDPPRALKCDLAVRIDGDAFVVAGSDPDLLPATLVFDVVAQDILVMGVTKGADLLQVPLIEMPVGVDNAELTEASPIDAPQSPPDNLLARLRIERDPDGPRCVKVRLRSISSHWAYHFFGRSSAGPLEITDLENRVRFVDLGLREMGGGRIAKVLRSREALPARAMYPHRFSLRQTGPSGSETLIPVLPSAGPDFEPISEGGAGGHLQSDIYVALA